VALSTLHHVIDLEWMKEAYRLTRKMVHLASTV
jgi:hypothetical protein